MAYKSCAANIAASIIQDCNRPLVGGYTGRAVIIPTADWARAEVVVDANNPRKIMSIVLPTDGSAMTYTIDNVFATPFTGSSTAGNNENGRNGYLKTLAIRIPMRGGDVSRDIIEPLVKDADGFVVIAEKRDKVGDGSYEVIGYQNSMRGDIASVTRDENANGGDWLVNLTTIEKWAEVTLVGSADTYESAKKEFEGLFGFEPNKITFTTENENERIILTANGLVYIDSVKNGENIRQTLSSPSDLTVSIENDANSEVVIYGEIIEFRAMYYTNAKLSELNVGGATLLKRLFVQNNISLTSLDLSKNTALTDLNCGSCTGLTSLDLSKNTALTYLDCNGCTGLTSLDLSKNTALTYLDCNGCTGLTSLDLSKNTALTLLDCYGCTGITSLDLSKNTALTYLNCNGCTGLTSLDLSKNTALTDLDCNGCTGLMLLDIQNTSSLEGSVILDQGMANLTTLQVAGTSSWAYEQVESWLNDYAPNDGKLYVDEDTPQAVITAAEAKEWEVIYQA